MYLNREQSKKETFGCKATEILELIFLIIA